MDKPRLEFAQLDPTQLAKVQELERELDTWVVALKPAVKPAQLSAKQLEKLQAAEKELGVLLLAYNAG